MSLTIGKLAKKLEISVETIRFYERQGLLKKPSAKLGAFRVYPEEYLSKIHFIKKAQTLGFTLHEVKELLELNTKPRFTCKSVKEKTLKKMEEITKKISDLTQMKESLQKLSECCSGEKESVKQFKVQECFEGREGCC